VTSSSARVAGDGIAAAVLSGGWHAARRIRDNAQSTDTRSGTITFNAVERDTYRDTGGALLPSDQLNNVVLGSANIVSNTNISTTLAVRCEQRRSSVLTLPSPPLSKTIYAVNGDTALAIAPRVNPSDTLTFRLTYFLNTGDFNNMAIVDYLAASGLQIHLDERLHLHDDRHPGFRDRVLGALDDCRAAVPRSGADLTTNALGNSVIFSFTNKNDPLNIPTTVDILLGARRPAIRLAMGFSPISPRSADQLDQRDHRGRCHCSSTGERARVERGQGRFDDDEPEQLFHRRAAAPWRPGQPGQRLRDAIHWRPNHQHERQCGLQRQPDWRGCGRPDYLRDRDFERGSLRPGRLQCYGQRHAAGRDRLSWQSVRQPGEWDLDHVTGNITSGLMFGDPLAPVAPSLASVTYTNGTNIAIITFDALIQPGVAPSPCCVNNAAAGLRQRVHAGPDFLASNRYDLASVTTANPTMSKALVGTEISNTNNIPSEATIGEVITYTVVISVPEGVMPNFIVTDTLDNGLAFVDCLAVAASPALSTGSGAPFGSVMCNDPTNPAISAAGGGAGANGRRIAWNFRTITNTDTNNSQPETIILTYTAVVLNLTGSPDNVLGQLRKNNVLATYNTTGTIALVTAPNVTLVEPALTLAKTANPTVGDAGDVITYALSLTPAAGGTNADAYDVVLTDTLPAFMVYDPLSPGPRRRRLPSSA
jgi:fimbrial isopeptide formation D2 family protein/uncharacterized repeat protein (TIGR01451 family)